ncbi:MAG: hypothetical protein RR326_18690, partial [Stenotrophomonas sp.]
VLWFLIYQRTASAHALNSEENRRKAQTPATPSLSKHQLKTDSVSGVFRFPPCSLHRALLGIKLTGNRP